MADQNLHSEIRSCSLQPCAADRPCESPGRCSCLFSWIRRLGMWGFCFFLIKGLLWLIIPAVIAAWTMDS